MKAKSHQVADEILEDECETDKAVLDDVRVTRFEQLDQQLQHPRIVRVELTPQVLHERGQQPDAQQHS